MVIQINRQLIHILPIKKERSSALVKTQHGYKIRIYPNQVQKDQLKDNFGCVRFVWNKMLELHQMRYKHNKTAPFLGEYDLNNLLPLLKKECSFLKRADATSLQVVNKNLTLAYKAFFNKSRKAPRFKSKRYLKQSYTTKSKSLTIIDKKHIFIPKLGVVRCRATKSIPTKILSGTVKKTASNQYYIVLIVESDKQPISKTNHSVGLDLGVSDLMITSDGIKIPTIRFDKELSEKKHYWEKRLARRRDQKDRKQASYKKRFGIDLDDSEFKNYIKAKVMVAKYSQKIANQRLDYLHKVTTSLVRQYDVIHMENLKTKNLLRNHKLSRAIANQAWGMIKQLLNYKTAWYEKELVLVNPYKTSQLCSNCGHDDGYHNLSIREWTCPNCHVNHDRDVNAAKNILFKTV